MIKKFKSFYRNSNNHNIISNSVYLFLLQGANFLLPLITFPYLVKVLGVDKFGLVVFAQAFITYFSRLADYGFNLSGIREISAHRNNKSKLTTIFSSIMIARLLLTVIGFIVMSIIVFSFERFETDWELYYLSYGIVIGTALFPTWFFQGMEKMKYITMLSLLAKIFFTFSIFIFVQTDKDYLYIPLLNSIGYIVIGFTSQFIILKGFQIRFKLQRVKRIKVQFLRGWHIFISKISINLYGTTNAFLLGIFTDNTTVGYYVIAEKAVRIISSLFAPIYQAIYPHAVQLVKKSKESATHFIQKTLIISIVLSIIIWIPSFLFAAPLFHLFFGEDVNKSIELFKIMSPLIIILPTAYLLFNIALLSFKLDRYFSRIYLLGGILNIILVLTFFEILNDKAFGISIALLSSELVITFMAFKLLYKKKILFNLQNNENQ